jgi:N-acetylglutamate synthase-like GNAT family acetyltransferase
MPQVDEQGPGLREVRIVAFEPAHGPAFRDLNLEWIEKFFSVEALDRQHLDRPQESFIDSGGAILMAMCGANAIGCCGLLPHGAGVYEISKMAVTQASRYGGVGRKLLVEMIGQARRLGARRLDIISSTRLGPALHLYRSVGFRDVPLESDTYARGNIALRLDLA